MKKTFYTPTGTETRDLTQQELERFAAMGDTDCKLEIAKAETATALTVEERLTAIEKYLGLR